MNTTVDKVGDQELQNIVWILLTIGGISLCLNAFTLTIHIYGKLYKKTRWIYVSALTVNDLFLDVVVLPLIIVITLLGGQTWLCKTQVFLTGCHALVLINLYIILENVSHYLILICYLEYDKSHERVEYCIRSMLTSNSSFTSGM